MSDLIPADDELTPIAPPDDELTPVAPDVKGVDAVPPPVAGGFEPHEAQGGYSSSDGVELADLPRNPRRLSDPYAGQRAQYEFEQKQREDLVRQAFEFTKDPGLTEGQVNLKIAQFFGVPEDVVQHGREKWLKEYAAASGDPKAWIRDHPLSAQLLLDHPEKADHIVNNKEMNVLLQGWNAVVDLAVDLREQSRKGLPTDNLDALSLQQRADDAKQIRGRAERDAPKPTAEVDDAEAARIREGGVLAISAQRAKEAQADLNKSRLWHQLLVARTFGKPTFWIEQDIHRAEMNSTPKYLGETGWRQALSETVGNSVSTVEVAKSALKKGGVGAGVGGLAGFAAGAALRNPALAAEWGTAGANFGGKLGGAVGAADASFTFEAGSSYEEFSQLRTADGQPLTDAEARGGALIAATVKTGIELAELTVLLKALGPAGEALSGGGAAAVREALATNPGFRTMAVRALKAWAAEGGEEVAQDAVDQATGYLLRSKHAETFQSEPVFNVARLKDNLVGGLMGGALFGAGGFVATAAQHSILAGKQERAALQAPELAKLAGDPTVQGMAGEVARLVTAKTSETGDDVTHVHIDPKAILRFFQNDEVKANEKAVELLGETGPQQMAGSLLTGQHMAVPLQPFFAKAGKEFAAGVADDMTTQAGAPTARQVKEKAEANEKWAQELAKGEVQSETLERFDALEAQLAATGTHSPSEAKAAVTPLRQVFLTFAKKFGQTTEDLFRGVRLSVNDGTATLEVLRKQSNVSEVLSRELHDGLAPEERARRLYVDPVTNLGTRRAFDETPRTAGRQVAVITSPDIKALNDHVEGGHDTANELLRTIGHAVSDVDPNAARHGTNFLFEVDSPTHLNLILDRLRKALPDAKLGLEGASAATLDDAFKKLDADTAEKRRTDAVKDDKGVETKPAKKATLPQRGETNFDLSKLKEFSFPAGKARARVSAELVNKAGLLSKEDFFREAYQDQQVPGVLNGTAWGLIPRKAHVASIDIRGLKAINGPNGVNGWIGDKLLKQFAQVLERNDGSDFDFAHLSGDEYAAQHDDPVKLKAWLDHVRAELAKSPIRVEDKGTGEFLEIEAEFRSGIGEKTYGAADRALNRAKVEEKRLRDEGKAAADQPGRSRSDVDGGRSVSPGVGRKGYERHGAPRQGFVDREVAADPQRFAQTASIRSGEETLDGIDAGEKNLTRDIAIALEKRQRKKYGIIARNDNSEAARKKIAGWMADEVEFEFKNKGKSGVGWYGKKWQAAIDLFGEEFPELKKDKTARDVFTILTAVTSDGQKVYTNFKAAAKLYDGYRKTGKIDVGAIGSQRAAGMDANFERINEMLASKGPAGMAKFLLQEKTVSELKKLAKEEGIKFDTEYKADVRLPMAAVVLGPKLGAFYANLMGADGYLTMDRWWSRTFNRYRGQIIPAATRPGLDRFKELLGDPTMDDDEAILHTVEHRNAYEAKNFKDGTEIEKAANTIYKAEFEELEDTPFNATDRSFMLETAREAKVELAKRGHKVSVADIQAILWYYEKRLYSELGARSSADVSYQEVAKRVTTERAQLAEIRTRNPDLTDEELEKLRKSFAKSGAAAVDEGSKRRDEPRGRAAQGVRETPDREVQGPDGASFGVGLEGEVAPVDPEVANLQAEFGLDRAEAEKMHRSLQKRKLRVFATDESGKAKGFTDIAREGIDAVYRVALTANADKSTFLHESAHVFLDLFAELAERADAPKSVVEDWATTLKWLGVENRQGIKRDQHEKWAKAFETYVAEGKFPADRLAGAFQRFRLWMMAVYKQLQNVGGEVSEDIRGVFDRLLATDTEIDATKRRMGLNAMPREALGMDAAAYAEHLDELQKATSHAAQVADFQVVKDQLRATEDWWKSAKADAKKKAAEAYENLPARRAQQLLQGKPVGDFLGIKEPLNKAIVEEMVGEKNAKKFKTAKDGVHPDAIVAAAEGLLGFATGKDMLEAVLKVPEKETWVDVVADNAMREQFPGVLDERTRLREIAAQGLHGKATKQWVLKEYAALNAKASQAPGEMAPAEVLKRAADIMAAGLTADRLRPRDAQLAERDAANNAVQAATRGNFAQAAVFKRQQLLNMYLHDAIVKAKAEVEAIEKKAAQLAKLPARQRLGKADPKYRVAIDSLLATFDFAEPEQDAQNTNLDAALQEVEKLMLEDETPVAFDRARIVDRAARRGLQGWRQLPVEDLRQLKAAMDNIEAAARNRSTVLFDDKRADKVETIANLKGEAEQLERRPDDPTREAETLGQTIGRQWNALDGALLKPETLTRFLSGAKDTSEFLKSTWFHAIVAPMQRAKVRELDLGREVLRPLVDKFDEIPNSGRQMEKLDGRKLFPSHVNIEAPQRRFEILMMLLNMGNQSNIDRLTRGRNITEEQVRAAAVAVGITKEEYEWVQSIWDTAEKLKPLAFDLEEKHTGVRPDEITARPLVTPFGTFAGGYFPAVYSNATDVGARQEARLAQFKDAASARPSTTHNYLISRVEDFSDVLSLSPNTINRHFALVIHDVAFREAVQSVGGLLSNEEVRQTMRERMGDGRAKQLLQWVGDVAQMRGLEGADKSGGLMRLATWMRGNIVPAVLGYKVPNALEDFTTNILSSIPASDLKPKHLAAGIAEFYATGKNSRAMALEKSGELRARQKQVQRELAKEVKDLTATGIGKLLSTGPVGWYKEHAFAFAEAVEYATATPIWIGAYRQALQEEKSEADAVTFADATVRQVVVSHNTVDLAPLMRDKSAIGYLTMFFGAFNHFYNQFRILGHDLGEADTLKTRASKAGRMLGLATGIFLVGSLVRGKGPEKDEPEWDWVLRKMFLDGVMQMVPLLNIVGRLGDRALSGKNIPSRDNSLFGTTESIGASLLKLADSDTTDEKRVKEFLKILGPTTGIPTAGPLQVYDALSTWALGSDKAN